MLELHGRAAAQRLWSLMAARIRLPLGIIAAHGFARARYRLAVSMISPRPLAGRQRPGRNSVPGASAGIQGNNAIAIRELQKNNSRHFLLREGAAPEFCLMRTEHSPSLIALGELRGRKLASAFMRSRVHNRTCDRGGKPNSVSEGVSIAPGPSGGAGGVGSIRLWLGLNASPVWLEA